MIQYPQIALEPDNDNFFPHEVIVTLLNSDFQTISQPRGIKPPPWRDSIAHWAPDAHNRRYLIASRSHLLIII